MTLNADLAKVIERLGIADDEHLSYLVIDNGRTVVGDHRRAADLVTAPIPAANTYVSYQPVDPGAEKRGRKGDVLRVTALFADLDIKGNGLPSMDAAHAVVDYLSGVVGTAPAAVISSGGGLQPLWRLPDIDMESARLLFSRWKMLVKAAARDLDGDADAVFDLTRVLRSPGSDNFKYAPPRAVTCYFPETFGTVDLAALTAVLDARVPMEEPKPQRVLRGRRFPTTADLMHEAVAAGQLDPLLVLGPGWSYCDSDSEGRDWYTRPGTPSTPRSLNTLDGVFVPHSGAIGWAEPQTPYSAAEAFQRSHGYATFSAAMQAVEAAASAFCGTGPREDGDAVLVGMWPEGFLERVDAARLTFQTAWNHERDLEEEVQRLRIRTEAKEILASERAGEDYEPMPWEQGDTFLAKAPEERQWSVRGIIPRADGRVLLEAMHKAGKTVLVISLVRSLLTGEPFLRHFAIDAPPRRVLVLDTEAGDDELRYRLGRALPEGVRDRLSVVSIKGQQGRYDPRIERVRSRMAQEMAALGGADVLVVDVASAWTASLGLDENSNSDIRHFLGSLEALADEAGIKTLVLAHHAGHTEERSRGASAFRDWPTGLLTLVLGEDGVRYLSANGRGVHVPETMLAFDPVSETMHVAGAVGVSRKEAASAARASERAESHRDAVLSVLAAGEMTRTELMAAANGRIPAGVAKIHNDTATALFQGLVEEGLLGHRKGSRGADVYSLAERSAGTVPGTPTVPLPYREGKGGTVGEDASFQNGEDLERSSGTVVRNGHGASGEALAEHIGKPAADCGPEAARLIAEGVLVVDAEQVVRAAP